MRHRLKRAFPASNFEERLPRRASRIRPQLYLPSKRRIHRTMIGRRIQILDGRFGRVQKVIEVVRIKQREMRRGQRDQRRRKQVQQQWGSCCMMRFVEESSIAAISISLPSRATGLTFGKAESFSSISFLQALNSLMQTHNLPPSLIGSSFPFNHNLSSFSKLSSAREVVVDLK